MLKTFEAPRLHPLWAEVTVQAGRQAQCLVQFAARHLVAFVLFRAIFGDIASVFDGHDDDAFEKRGRFYMTQRVITVDNAGNQVARMLHTGTYEPTPQSG